MTPASSADSSPTISNYRFTNPSFLIEALTHKSYVNERRDSGRKHNERLEFLGDALLDMVCVDYLYRHFPEADPQWLTEHKMAMVSNQFLGCLCVRLILHKHMMFMTAGLGKNISDDVQAVNGALDSSARQARVFQAATRCVSSM